MHFLLPSLLILVAESTVKAFVVAPCRFTAVVLHPRPHSTLPTTSTSAVSAAAAAAASATAVKKGFELSGLVYDSTSTAFEAWEWTANLGAPAALVAGAVLVTLSESRGSMAPVRSDTNVVRTLKQLTRFLLFSSFALEVLCIFVSTMTGTVLLSQSATTTGKLVGYGSPLALLKHHHEIEFLTIQVGFLQGLINWLCAVGIEFWIPKQGESKSAKRMNQFMASCCVTLVFWIMAFYNHHLSFYSDYLSMLRRYFILFVGQYFGSFRPMSLLYAPSSIFCAALGWRAFNTKPDDDD